MLEGIGRMRIDGELLTLEARSAVLITADSLRQLFNDTEADQLWLVVGAPPEPANTLDMTAEQLAYLYPDGPKALPPELARAFRAPAADVEPDIPPSRHRQSAGQRFVTRGS